MNTGSRHQERGGGAGPRPQQNQGEARPDLRWVQEVIQNGNYAMLDEEAKKIGGKIADEATRTKVRGLFGTVKRFELLNEVELTQALVLLRPRLAYAAARADGTLNTLRDVLTEASKLTEQNPAARMQRLVDLMEAILCYSIAARRDKDPRQ